MYDLCLSKWLEASFIIISKFISSISLSNLWIYTLQTYKLIVMIIAK